jgi:hypothetical protein
MAGAEGTAMSEINHQLTFERPDWHPRKEICTTLNELEEVINYAIKWRVDTWDDYTDTMIHRIEFSGEALRQIMQAGLESLARKKVRRHPELKEIKL